MEQNDDFKFSLKISIFNTIASLLVVGIPTYADSLFEHHISHGGAISYPLGYFVLLIGIPVFILTFYVNNKKNFSPVKKAYLTFFSLIIPCYLTLPNFLPEFPHQGLITFSLYHAPIIAFTVYVHGLRKSFKLNKRGYSIKYISKLKEFIKNPKIDKQARIERLRIEHSTWLTFLLTLITAFVSIGALALISYFDLATKTTTSIKEQILLTNLFNMNLIVCAIIFLVGFVFEYIHTMNEIRSLFKFIKTDRK